MRKQAFPATTPIVLQETPPRTTQARPYSRLQFNNLQVNNNSTKKRRYLSALIVQLNLFTSVIIKNLQCVLINLHFEQGLYFNC